MEVLRRLILDLQIDVDIDYANIFFGLIEKKKQLNAIILETLYQP